jgi:hypothetical protein
MRLRLAIVVVLSLAWAESGIASISVASNAQRPALRVDAKGTAEVSWTAAGRRRTLTIPATGLYLPGGRLSGPDVSVAARLQSLPFARATRRVGSTFYALQAWRVEPGGPVELHFSRWQGLPTTVTLRAEPASGSERLIGRAEFQGKAVYGYSRTNSGIRYRIFAFLDCFGCPAPAWRRMSAVAPPVGGEFRLLVRPLFLGTRYRVTIAGPNIGRTLAPDASAVTPSAR